MYENKLYLRITVVASGKNYEKGYFKIGRRTWTKQSKLCYLKMMIASYVDRTVSYLYVDSNS